LFHRAGAIWLIIDPVTDQVNSLNQAAFWLWYHCDGVATEQQLAQWLAKDAEIPFGQALSDVVRGVEVLHEKGLVIRGEGHV